MLVMTDAERHSNCDDVSSSHDPTYNKTPGILPNVSGFLQAGDFFSKYRACRMGRDDHRGE